MFNLSSITNTIAKSSGVVVASTTVAAQTVQYAGKVAVKAVKTEINTVNKVDLKASYNSGKDSVNNTEYAKALKASLSAESVQQSAPLQLVQL